MAGTRERLNLAKGENDETEESQEAGLEQRDDPRAFRVERITCHRAHGEIAKPMLMLRDEHFAELPHFRLQVTGFARSAQPSFLNEFKF